MYTSRDLYEVLGVSRSADSSMLKKAYRNLAMKYHPDRNPGDSEAEAKFKEVSHAYDILKDSEKRSSYDRYGNASFDGSSGSTSDPNFNGFSDIFDEMFGEFMGSESKNSNSSRYANLRGNDLNHNLDISLEEAFKGVKKKYFFNF